MCNPSNQRFCHYVMISVILTGDLCILTETWLKPETSSRFVNFPGYSLTRADRSDGRGYGGVAVLCRSGFRVKRLQSVCSCGTCKLETLWLSVSDDRGRRFSLCAVYRPPRPNMVHLSADFDCLEAQLQRVLLMSARPHSYHRGLELRFAWSRLELR